MYQFAECWTKVKMARFFHQNNNVIFRSVGFANPTLRKIVQHSDQFED
jgi:hypothetical protein